MGKRGDVPLMSLPPPPFSEPYGRNKGGVRLHQETFVSGQTEWGKDGQKSLVGQNRAWKTLVLGPQVKGGPEEGQDLRTLGSSSLG